MMTPGNTRRLKGKCELTSLSDPSGRRRLAAMKAMEAPDTTNTTGSVKAVSRTPRWKSAVRITPAVIPERAPAPDAFLQYRVPR